MLPFLLHVALLMQLGSVPLDPPSIELETRRRELGLLHSSLDRTALRTLSVWDPQTDSLREPRPGEAVDDNAPVMILHLWATWCVPCKEEFPIWAAMGQHLTARHKGKIRIVHVALQNDSSDMAAFVRQLPDKLPFPVKYFDHSELLAARLRQAFDNSQAPLPLTLILDSQRVVRQAFLGSIHSRRQELADATARLVRLAIEQPDFTRPPATLASVDLVRPKTSPVIEPADPVKRAEFKQQQEAAMRLRRDELVGPAPPTNYQGELLPHIAPPQAAQDDTPIIQIDRSPPLPPIAPRRPRWRVILGGVTTGAGLVLLGFGASALAAQGSCIPDPMSTCDYVFSTKVIGGSFIGIGGALAVQGIVLMAVPGK